jgi:hypothetical protein
MNRTITAAMIAKTIQMSVICAGLGAGISA